MSANSQTEFYKKRYEEAMAFIALNHLMVKYYEWCKENFWKEIYEDSQSKNKEVS